jgi:polysaccharide biosynthesis transport protein
MTIVTYQQPTGALRNQVANGAMPGEPEPGGNPLTIMNYLRIARRWYLVILGCVIGALVLGIIITLLMTPRYTARSTIEIARESNKIVDIQGVQQDASVGDLEFYQTQYGLLQSVSLAQRVASQLKLVDSPKFFDQFGKSQTRNLRPDGLSFTAQGRPERLRVAGKIMLDNVGISPTRLSRLVAVEFTSPDAVMSANIANTWTSAFIDETLERRYRATSYARKFLETRLQQVRERLEASERDLVAYASRQKIISLPNTAGKQDAATIDRSIVTDDLTAINGALATATADRIAAEAKYQQSRASGGNFSAALKNDTLGNLRQKRAELSAEYSRLLSQFEPGYPAAKSINAQLQQIDRSIAQEERRTSASVAAEYRESLERETALKARVGGLQGDFLDLRRRSIQYNIYQREVDTNRQLYDGLLQRYKEVGVAGGVGVNNISVVDDAAPPEKPSSPRIVLNMALALLAGLLAGLGVAFVLEQNDDVLNDPSDLKQRLGLAVLGTVPKIEGARPTEALLDRKSSMVDAYLAIQTNLSFATDHGIPKTLAVTSTRPAEGKSTTAFAIATMLARADKRVILVDGDMRSPSVHELAGSRHDFGLSNYLTGADDVAKMIAPLDGYGIMVMTAGPTPPNAAELLIGDRFAALLAMLTTQFDHVVVDSPPVMGLADAPLICSAVEGAVFVVEANSIRSVQVKAALKRLNSASVHLVGSVLTKFDHRRSNSGFDYEYGYSYGRPEAKG